MHDLVIRGGTIVDGTGRERFEGDVAVDAGRVTAVGAVPSRGRRELDARHRVVAPGFVDVHTHYDGQVTWDPELSPSSWHGVTTLVMGNCGVGFAPVRPGAEDFLIELMEGVCRAPTRRPRSSSASARRSARPATASSRWCRTSRARSPTSRG